LGHIVGKVGVRVDPKNIEAMQDFPHPKTLKILRGFLGLNMLLLQACSEVWKDCGTSHLSP
jgi:hypothetical protein